MRLVGWMKLRSLRGGGRGNGGASGTGVGLVTGGARRRGVNFGSRAERSGGRGDGDDVDDSDGCASCVGLVAVEAMMEVGVQEKREIVGRGNTLIFKISNRYARNKTSNKD